MGKGVLGTQLTKQQHHLQMFQDESNENLDEVSLKQWLPYGALFWWNNSKESMASHFLLNFTNINTSWVKYLYYYKKIKLEKMARSQ